MSGEYTPVEDRHHFERPGNWFNHSLRWIADRRDHAELNQEGIDELQDNSIETFKGIAIDHEALEKVRAATDWYMTDISCPSMVLSGEVTLDDDGDSPEARFFADAPILTIKDNSKREANLLSATDHFTGHLYAYFTGATDFDEHAAVYWQNRAAVERFRQGDIRFRYTPILNMLAYKFHKEIPFSVYSPQSLPFVGPLPNEAPSVEHCRLRDPSVAGWSRITSSSPTNGIITSYRHDILPTGVSKPPDQHDARDWEMHFTGNSPDTYDGVALTRPGRPLQADLEMLAMTGKSLVEAGLIPDDTTKPSATQPSVGGFNEVFGY